MQVVKTFNSRMEAEVEKGVLEANGITAVVSADDAGGAYPFPLSPNGSWVQLLVEEKDLEKALKILKETK